ncbi:MAG: phage minor head protein [Kiritimatiellia bacterium]
MTPGGFTRSRRRADIGALRAMWPEIRGRAFAVQGIEDFAKLKRVQDAVAAVHEGGRWDEQREKIAAEIGGDDAAAARRHAETVLKTNCAMAYAAARYQKQQGMKDVYPYWKYVTMDDGRERDSHAELNGVILPADDPFWEAHYPPWDFNCRCMVIQLTPEDAREEAESGEGSMWSEGTRQDWMARNRGRDSAREFQHRPGSVEIDVRSLAAAKGRTREDMEAFLGMMEKRRLGTGEFGADGRERETTVRDWLWEPVKREYHGKALEHGRRTGKERAYVLDRVTGAELASVDGEAHSVSIASVPWSPAEKAVIHNHPSGIATLSPRDLLAATRADVGSVEAVAATGWMEVRARGARAEHIREAIRGWDRKFKEAEGDALRHAILRLEWMDWLDAQRRYGYIQLHQRRNA